MDWSEIVSAEKAGSLPSEAVKDAPISELLPIEGAGRVLNGGDFHFPDNNEYATAKFILSAKNADTIIINGDLCDFYAISKHNPDPRRKDTLQDELDQAYEFLYELRTAAPEARIHFNSGNHEDRMKRFLRSNATALESLRCLTLEALLRFDELDISSAGTNGILVGEDRVKHGTIVRRDAGASGKAEAEAHWRTVVMGHTHRRGKVPITKDGRTFYGIEAGCMCSLTPSYVSNPNWQPGWAERTEYGVWSVVEL